MSKGFSAQRSTPAESSSTWHQLEGAVPAVAEEVAHDPHVVRIVFHQQDSDVVDAA